MKPNPNRSLLKRENLRNLLGGQLLHIVEHKNNAQGWRDAQNCLVEQMVLLGREDIAFRSHPGILKQSPQFIIVRHQLVERKEVHRGVSGLAANAPAAISSDGVKPNGHLLWSLEFGKVPDGAGEHLLHGIFRIFRMAADLHAEGIDRILQQTDRLFDGFRSVALQQVGGSDQFRSHRMGSWCASSVYSRASREEPLLPGDSSIHRAEYSFRMALRTGSRRNTRIQSRLDHLKADWRYLL